MGRTIPKALRVALAERLERHAAKRWKETCREVVVTFRGPYAYVGALKAREEFPPWFTKAQRAKLAALPTPLCRLEYLGRAEAWGFGFYKASDDGYERNVLPNGSWTGTPEECFDCAATAYLQGGW